MIYDYIVGNIKKGLNKPTKIEKIIFSVTYLCNSKCRMCSCWQEDKNNRKHELTFKQIEQFLYENYPLFKDLKEISITGGEPFLKKDIDKIIELFLNYKKDIKVSVSTNGLLTNLILNYLKEINDERLKISISLDGLKEKHELIRRIPGGYDKTISTIKQLKQKGIRLQIGMLLTPLNYLEFLKVKKLAEQLDCDFIFQIMNKAEYFGEQEFISFKDTQIKEIEEMIGTDGTRTEKFIKKGILDYLKGKASFNCFAGFNSFHLDPYGNIFACLPNEFYLGNIKINSMIEIWFGEGAEQRRKQVKKCNNCWLLCQLSPSMKYNIHNLW